MSTSPIPPDTVLRRLEWTVLRRLDGLLHGDYRTFFRGSGLDLADLREYQFHDDVRHIDWNVTARLATPYVREFNEERDLTAWFLLDLSASVDFGSHGELKSGVARDLVAVLARVLTRHGNRVGAMLYTDRVDTVLPPRSGRRHVLALMHAIERTPQRPAPHAKARDSATCCRAAQGALRRRAWCSSCPTSSARRAGKSRLRRWRTGTTWSPCVSMTRSRWRCPTSASW